MIDGKYTKAYVEVLDLLQHLPKDEYQKIPQEEIDFFENNKDANYVCKIDYDKPLEEQDISQEANSIIVNLFLKYFATDVQKEKVEKILEQNEQKAEEYKREKYNPNDIFKKEEIIKNEPVISLVECKQEKWYSKFIEFMKKIFKK